ncbi:MAG: hypothetical protein JWR75_1808 [Devosia sp.]|nr:hypothetical protein [Devosia sp.]
MKFMTTVVTTNGNAAGAPPPELMQAIGKFGMEAMQAGVLIETGGMGLEATVTVTDAEVVAQDGPFAETKELLGGYAIYELPNRDAAMDWVQRFADLHRSHWKGWEGRIEVMQLMSMSGSGAR